MMTFSIYLAVFHLIFINFIQATSHDQERKINPIKRIRPTIPLERQFIKEEKDKKVQKIDLSHIPLEILKFGLVDFISEKDKEALKSCEPQFKIQNSSFKIPHEEIIEKLKIKWGDYKGKKLVDLGGGYSKLLPYLRKQEINAYSLDPFYGKKPHPLKLFPNEKNEEFLKKELADYDFIQNYEKENRRWLIKSKIEDLPQVRYFADLKEVNLENTVDMVTSHNTWGYIGGGGELAGLTGNLEKQKELRVKSTIAQIEALKKTLQILKVGGSARINGISSDVRQRFLSKYPPMQNQYDWAEIEVEVPKNCDCILDRGFHVDGKQRAENFFFLFKK